MEQAAHCRQCRELRPKLVARAPGRTHWACAESISAGAFWGFLFSHQEDAVLISVLTLNPRPGGRGGKEEQGVEEETALHPCAVPLSGSYPSLGPKQLSLDLP